jgi:hypothetical protein
VDAEDGHGCGPSHEAATLNARGRGRTRATGNSLVALSLVAALTSLGAVGVPASTPSLCIPLLTTCDSPTPTPVPSSGPAPIAPLPIPGSPPPGTVTPSTLTTPSPGVPPASAPDPNAPTFTLPAAQLTGSSISFTGLHSVSYVTVPLAVGRSTPVVKLTADDIVITDFHLTVRKATGPALVSDSSRMELRGNIRVYVDSITATLLDGTPLTLGASTPPPGNDVPPTLMRVNLGLVGVTADSISFVPSHQQLE